MVVHSHFAKVPGKISKFLELLDSDTGEVKKKKPMFIGGGESAKVLIKLDEKGCFELK